MNNTTSEYVLMALGGTKFLSMTGAKGLVTDGENLVFSLPKKSKGINKVKIQYNKSTDSFDCTFYNFSPRQFRLDVVNELENIHVSELKRVFETTTGLLTSL